MSESESAMILVEHNIKRAYEISDRLLKVNDGRLVDYILDDSEINPVTTDEGKVVE